MTKRCKPTHKKTYGYNSCEQTKEIYKYGLCKKCFGEWMFNDERGKEHYKSQFIPKVKSKIVTENKNKLRQKKQKLKSIQQLIKEARVPFQKWIRKRDENKPCISCGNEKSNIWDGGHYYKAELYSGLIFDEDNVHKQCRKCNSYLGGNEREYKKGLEKRYGNDFVLKLEQKSVNLRSRKYTREELVNIKNNYQKKLRETQS